jgi:hypothetical protein
MTGVCSDGKRESRVQKRRQNPGKPFRPGNPGGPGRPAGSPNRATLLLDKLAEEDGKDILARTIEAAEVGDLRAADIVLSRVWPVRRGGRPVTFELPTIETAADIVKAVGNVATAVAGGELTPEEGNAVAAILEVKRKAIETTDLETRIAALEQRQ